MFIKGSRYRSLPESSPIDAAGERLRGKDLRLIPPPLAWPFRHTVREGDRLDLLSFKYYTEPTKWWQIADANPQEPFPTDLLDSRPLIKEIFALRSLNFETRFRDLVIALSAFGEVSTPVTTSFDGPKPADPNFVEITLVVTYLPAPATHQAIVDSIQAVAVGFHFLRAFAWLAAPRVAESFSFDDPLAKGSWQAILNTLADAPGVFEVESMMSEGILKLYYNSAVTPRESLLAIFESNGFTVEEAAAFSTVGSQIVIPPNQVV